MTEFNLQAGIPTLNIKRYTEGNAEEKKVFVDELGAAFRIVGFVVISGHGVPSELLKECRKDREIFLFLKKLNLNTLHLKQMDKEDL